MFSRIRVGDTSFHFKSLERFANSTDSGSPIPTLVPVIFGGPYNVIFKGNVTIPQ